MSGTSKILESNVAELQKQLQEAYKHIDELNTVKNSAQKVIDAHDSLNEFFHLESKDHTILKNKLNKAIKELKSKITLDCPY